MIYSVSVWVEILAADILILAGIAKVASPAALDRALADVLPLSGPLGDVWIRAIGGYEAAVGALVLVSPTLPIPVGYVLLALTGILFIVIGVIGRLRGASVPCGCFGIRGSKPFGLSNVAMGTAFVLVSVLGLFYVLAQPAARSLGANLSVALLLAGAGLVAFTLAANGPLVSALLRTPRDAP